MIQINGMAAMSVVRYVVTPSIKLVGTAARPIQRSRRPQVTWFSTGTVSFVERGAGVSSLGCIGNRVYTDLPDDEFYYALPGQHLAAIVNKLQTIANANRELEKYHRTRLQAANASV